MASLHDLHRALFPTARPLGAAELAPERADREVGWVRVLKPRVPAFEALETGDLAIIPGAALAVVAPRVAQVEELAVALARARCRRCCSSTARPAPMCWMPSARRSRQPD